VAVLNVVFATDKPEHALARQDGPEVLAPTAVVETPHLPTEPPLAPADAQYAHTRTTNVVVVIAETATDKPESALARMDGQEVLALDVTDKSELPPTTEALLAEDTVPPLPPEDTVPPLPPETTSALTAHTNTPNAVELNVEIVTELLEPASARTDGPEVHARPATEDPETPPTEAKSSNALCAHTRSPSVVEVTVEIATDKLESADARADGAEALARTEEGSLVLDTLAPTKLMLALLTEPLLTQWDLSGLPSLESLPPSASSSSWS